LWERLRTPANGTAIVVGGCTPAQDTGQMWDLTVPNDHEFYIDTTTADIMVHNDNGPSASRVPNMTGMTPAQADKILSEHGFELKSIYASGKYLNLRGTGWE
jgi:hypothetical protein